MAVETSTFSIHFPAWYDDRGEAESTSKGYLPNVEVQLGAAERYRLYFIDPVRLQQTLDDDTRDGRPWFAEPGLVVVPEVSTEAVKQAVAGLVREGYFQHQKPIVNGD